MVRSSGTHGFNNHLTLGPGNGSISFHKASPIYGLPPLEHNRPLTKIVPISCRVIIVVPVYRTLKLTSLSPKPHLQLMK